MRQAGRRYWPLAHLTKGHPLTPAPIGLAAERLCPSLVKAREIADWGKNGKRGGGCGVENSPKDDVGHVGAS